MRDFHDHIKTCRSGDASPHSVSFRQPRHTRLRATFRELREHTLTPTPHTHVSQDRKSTSERRERQTRRRAYDYICGPVDLHELANNTRQQHCRSQRRHHRHRQLSQHLQESVSGDFFAAIEATSSSSATHAPESPPLVSSNTLGRPVQSTTSTRRANNSKSVRSARLSQVICRSRFRARAPVKSTVSHTELIGASIIHTLSSTLKTDTHVCDNQFTFVAILRRQSRSRTGPPAKRRFR